ncbi:MAG: cbiN [Nocardioidaceae bacterium]|nr:cbiN [Nocardioidaceae bacterium]
MSPGTETRRRTWVDVLLLVAVVAIFAVPLALRLNTEGQPDGETYAGSDSTAISTVESNNPNYEPWFSPLFEPSSGQVESGLFALQAAVGAGVLGYVLGRLSDRRRREGDSGPATPPSA